MPDTTPIPSTPGTRGHTRTTWDHGLRALFRRLRAENPTASKAELQALYMIEYRLDDEFIEEAGIRVFGNDYKCWLDQREEDADADADADAEPERQSAPARQQQPERLQQPVRPRRQVSPTDLAAVGQRLRNVILLDLVQPNGKPLRDCTGTEAGEFGGWLIAVRDRVGGRIIGEVLSEDEARSIRDGGNSE